MEVTHDGAPHFIGYAKKKMITGWHGDYYLTLFDEQIEAAEMARRYGISDRLPGYSLIGLRSWDDFILLSRAHEQKIVPTVPLIPELLGPWDAKIDLASICPEPSIGQKVKWHVTTLVFGGAPEDPANTAWLSIDQHAESVNWWNRKFDVHRTSST